MNKQLSIAVVLASSVLASCGGKSKPAPVTPPSNEETAGTGGDAYGDEWGGGYGGVGYGDGEYGGEYGGEGYGGGEAYVPPPPVAPDIVGTWATACAPRHGKSDEFVTMTFVNTADHWDVVFAIFGDKACAKRKSMIHLAGAYTIGAQSTTVPGAWEGNFTFEARDITADDAKNAKAIGKLCGIKKMKPGKAVDIYQKGCAKMGLQPVAACGGDYDLVALDGDRVEFGVRPADNDMCTAEKRPTALDTAGAAGYQWPKSGIAVCDEMLGMYSGYARCQALPPEVRNQIFLSIRDTIPQMITQLTADPTNASSQCQQAVDGMKQALAATGC
jgi:hypothetical protein